MIPIIKPRLYSIASSPRESGSRVQLLVTIPTEVARHRGQLSGGGLATTFLTRIPVGTDVPVCIAGFLFRSSSVQ